MTSAAQSQTSRNLVFENAIAGTSSGVVGTVIGYPFDLLKTRLQVTSKDYKKGSSTGSAFQMSASILRNEGPQGFFKGLMAPLVSISFISTVTFASYSWLRPQLGAHSGWDWRNALAATLTAPLMVPITTAEGLVRTQMQVDNINKGQFKGSWHCLKLIAERHGPATLFTGMMVTLSRDSAYLCTYFYVYEGMKATLHGDVFSNLAIPAELAIPLAGGTSGAMAWLTSFPFDCVRAGVQGQSLDDDKQRKTGRKVFKELMESRGIRSLYRGVSAAVMRAFIVSSTRFSAYEITLWLFRRNQEKEG